MITGHELRAILGKRIQFYRKQRQLSQAALAEQTGISITFLSNIERGLKYPTSETLSNITNGLGVEVNELFLRDDAPEERRVLLDRFKKDITDNVLKTLENVYKAYDK